METETKEVFESFTLKKFKELQNVFTEISETKEYKQTFKNEAKDIEAKIYPEVKTADNLFIAHKEYERVCEIMYEA